MPKIYVNPMTFYLLNFRLKSVLFMKTYYNSDLKDMLLSIEVNMAIF